MIRILLLTSLSVFLVSCNRTKQILISNDKFVNIKKIEGKNLKIKVLNQPNFLGIINEYLIVTNKYENPRFEILDVKADKIITQFGYFNDGIKIINPFYFNRTWSKEGEHFFEIVDFQQNKILHFSLENALANKKSLTTTIDLPFELVKNYKTLFTTNNGNLWGSYSGVNKKKGRLFNYNFETKEFNWIKYYPLVNNYIFNEDLPFLYYSYSSYNEKRDIIGSAQKYFKRVDFFDSKNNLIVSTEFANEDSINYKPQIIQNMDIKAYYNSSFAGDKFFYATCINSKQKNYNNVTGEIELHIFDWSGDIKTILKLDRMYTGHFVVNELTKKLYIISYLKQDSEFPIIEYDLFKDI